MDQVGYLKKADLNNSYLLRGNAEEVRNILDSVFSEKNINVKGNPDFYIFDSENLTVEDSRKISEFASLSPINGRKYICIYAKTMTVEAQNALLKVVEEASGKSSFFFILEIGTPILPTLVSRCVELKFEEDLDKTKEGEEFIRMSYKERLELSEKIAKDQDRESARRLVRSLLAISDKKKLPSKVLKDLLEADKYLRLSGSSPKGVLGHLALVI